MSPVHGGGTSLVFAPTDPGPKRHKNRWHLDLRPDDRAAFVQRALALGARPVEWAASVTGWTVLADPEGNEFCVLQSVAEHAAFVARNAGAED